MTAEDIIREAFAIDAEARRLERARAVEILRSLRPDDWSFIRAGSAGEAGFNAGFAHAVAKAIAIIEKGAASWGSES